MKKSFIVAMFIIAVLAALTSCTKKVSDPVNDVVPVDTSFWAGNVVTPQGDTITATTNSRFDRDSFQVLGKKGEIDKMRKMVDEHRVELTANVVAHFPEITEPDSIHFELWTGHVKDVQSGDGNNYSGEIKNELVFRITDPKVKTIVFLACGNGMLSNVSELEQGLTRIDFGTANPWLFVVEKGEGLANHLEKIDDWIRVAKTFPVPIKDKDGKIVPPERCRQYLGKWTTGLFPGDTINMVTGEVRNKHGKVDFQRRQQETKKANKASKRK